MPGYFSISHLFSALSTSIEFNANLRRSSLKASAPPLDYHPHSLINTREGSLKPCQYEDLTGDPLGLPVGVGKYDDLVYNPWITATGEDSLAGGVMTHSLPDSVLTYDVLQLTNGTPSFTVATPYKSVSFIKDFWFGCNLNALESAADVAVKCTVTVSAFQKNVAKAILVAKFTLTPPVNPLQKAPMIHAVLPSCFANVYDITVLQDNPVTEALIVDNLHYTVKT